MTPFAEHLSSIISIGAILGHVAIFALLASLIFKKEWHFTRLAKKHSILLAFLTALGGMIFSLVYSDIIGFVPCELCHIQRLFLYPQVITLGYLLFKESAIMRKISIGLSLVGAAIAIYHYYGQMFNAKALAACETTGVSCSQILFIKFGYVTIPMLSLTAFALILALLYQGRK